MIGGRSALVKMLLSTGALVLGLCLVLGCGPASPSDSRGLTSSTGQTGKSGGTASATDSPTTTTLQPSSTSTAGVASLKVPEYLDTLDSVWKVAGIPVLGVSTLPLDEATGQLIRENTENTDVLPYVTLEVPEESVSDEATRDGPLLLQNIMRQATVAVRQGVPLKYLGVVTVDADGKRSAWFLSEIGQLAGSPSPEWDKPASLSLDLVEEGIRKSAQTAAKKAGVTPVSVIVDEDPSGRVVTVTASIEDVDLVTASVASLGISMQDAARLLNQEGAKISGVNVKVDDADLVPVLRYAASFLPGGDMTGRYLAPQLDALIQD